MRMSDAAQVDVGAAIAEMQRMLGMASVASEEHEPEEKEESKPGISFAEFKRDKWKAWTRDGNAAPTGSGWLTDGTILLRVSAFARKPPYKSMTERTNNTVRIEAIEHLINGAQSNDRELWRATRDEWVNICHGYTLSVLLMSPGGMEPPVPICPSKAKLIEYLIPDVQYWCVLGDMNAPIQLQVERELVGLLMPLRAECVKPKAWSGVTEVKA